MNRWALLLVIACITAAHARADSTLPDGDAARARCVAALEKARDAMATVEPTFATSHVEVTSRSTFVPGEAEPRRWEELRLEAPPDRPHGAYYLVIIGSRFERVNVELTSSEWSPMPVYEEAAVARHIYRRQGDMVGKLIASRSTTENARRFERLYKHSVDGCLTPPPGVGRHHRPPR